MKLQYLGTAAAEGWPGLFCNCEQCETARLLGRRNIRTRSQACVYADKIGSGSPDDILLIDLPPDTYMHVLQHGLRLDRVGHLLVTHSHTDHYLPSELEFRGSVFANPIPSFPLVVYGNETVGAMFLKALPEVPSGVEFQLVNNFEPFQAGSYTVTALPALHDRKERCLIYMIEYAGKRILYGNDTGIFPEEVFEFIAGKTFDLISLDCTSGIESEGTNHMGLPDAVDVKRRLDSLGCLKAGTRIVLHHFSHNGGAYYDRMVELAAPYNMDVSYDGGVWDV